MLSLGGDVKGVFSRLANGIKAVGDSVKAEDGRDFLGGVIRAKCVSVPEPIHMS